MTEVVKIQLLLVSHKDFARLLRRLGIKAKSRHLDRAHTISEYTLTQEDFHLMLLCKDEDDVFKQIPVHINHNDYYPTINKTYSYSRVNR